MGESTSTNGSRPGVAVESGRQTCCALTAHEPSRGGSCSPAPGHVLHYGTSKIRECRRHSSNEDPHSLLISVGAAFDIYVLVYSVEGLTPGAYLYELEWDALSPKRSGDLRESARAALAGQPDPTNAAATVLLVADFDRYQWRYRHERALRNLYLECGRLMQPLILVATALGLQTGITPAIRDQLVGALVALDLGNWQALHSLTIS